VLLVIWCLWFAALAVFFTLALVFTEDLQSERDKGSQEPEKDFNEGHD